MSTPDAITSANPGAALVDERFGVVRHLAEDPRRGGMPSAQRQWVAHVADATAFGAPPVDRLSFGNATDPAVARAAALGEAAERYCGNIVPTGLPDATWHDLYAAGEAAVDPDDLALFSEGQYAVPGFPFVPFTRDTPVPWTEGRDMASGRPVLVPASLTYLNLRAGPATGPLVYAGIAAGPTAHEAHLAALYEVVERDATAIWWAARGPSVSIAEGDVEAAVAAFDDLAGDERTVRLHALPNAFDLPVVAAFVEDHRRNLIGFGTACRHRAADAAAKALTEAFGLLEVAADLADPDSPLWDATRLGLFPDGLFKEFRADRSYRSVYREDFRDLLDLPAVAQLYLDPGMQAEPLDRLRSVTGPVALADLDRSPAADPPATALLDDVLARVVAAGLHSFAVDLTTTDVAEAGLHVTRVVVPGAYSNSPPAFPYLGGRRLREVPRTLGWYREPLPEHDLCLLPIPLG